MSSQDPSRAGGHALTPLPRLEDLPRSGEGFDREKVGEAFDAFRRHVTALQAQLRVLQAAPRSAITEPSGHAVRMDALHLIRSAAEFADTMCVEHVCVPKPDPMWSCIGHVDPPAAGGTKDVAVRLLDLITNEPVKGVTAPVSLAAISAGAGACASPRPSPAAIATLVISSAFHFVVTQPNLIGQFLAHGLSKLWGAPASQYSRVPRRLTLCPIVSRSGSSC